MTSQKYTSLLFCIASLTIVKPAIGGEYQTCRSLPEVLKARSLELNNLEHEDQQDREHVLDMTVDDWDKVAIKDRIRRQRVGEIFGEGCFHSAEDYEHAALIFQHGDSPDHFYQAFVWSIKAADLGAVYAKGFAALAIDRYLVNINKKQLFGSQANKLDEISNCYCMEPVEETFPDTYRQEYTGLSLQDRVDWISSLNQGKHCSILECPTTLEASPKGILPGFW